MTTRTSRKKIVEPPLSPVHGRLRPQLQVIKQLSVFLDNCPGTLAKLTNVLGGAGINIYAISTSDTIDHSVVRLVLDDPHAALALLEARGTLVVEKDVIMLDGLNRPGSLAEIAEVLAKANINLEYAYCATHPTSARGIMILRPNNVAKAMKALNTW